MGTFERLQRKSSISSARAASTSDFLRASRSFAPSATSTHEQVTPDQQMQGHTGAGLRYSLARIPIFSAERENHTGMPDHLKTGIENLSGISMHDVRVHYNSSKPAQVQALAYTQGVNIHIGAGQEKHLPHEAWHVVQQKQGRVQPTVQAKGVGINDDEELEREADVMGAKAFQGVHIQTVGAQENQNPASNAPVQMEDGGYQRALYQLAGVLGIAGSAQAIEDTITSSTGISYGTLLTLFFTLGAVFVPFLIYHIRNRIPVKENVKKEEAEKEVKEPKKEEPEKQTGTSGKGKEPEKQTGTSGTGKEPEKQTGTSGKGKEPEKQTGTPSKGEEEPEEQTSTARDDVSKRPMKGKGTGGGGGGSGQGEHIFNALGDLAVEIEKMLRTQISQSSPSAPAATVSINDLQQQTQRLIDQRNNREFRAASKGDPANSYRYSSFAQRTRQAIKQIILGGPSEMTRGYTDLNQLLNQLDYYTIDETAHQSRREELARNLHQTFDDWFNTTRDLMHSTFAALRDAALAVSRTRGN